MPGSLHRIVQFARYTTKMDQAVPSPASLQLDGPNFENFTQTDKILEAGKPRSSSEQGNDKNMAFYQYDDNNVAPEPPAGFDAIQTEEPLYTDVLEIPGDGGVIRVVGLNDADAESAGVCLLGSQQHTSALKRKVSALEMELNQLQGELKRFDNASSTASILQKAKPRVHQSVKQFGGNADNVLVAGQDDYEDLQGLKRFQNGRTMSSLPTANDSDSEENSDGPADILYKAPRVRQYFVKDRLYREKEEHKTSWLELFFDLIFVGIVAQIGHFWAVDPSWKRAAEMLVVFSPVWRILQDANTMNGNFDTGEDLFSKLFTFVIMSLAVGMGTSAYNVWYLGYASTGVLFYAFYLVSRLVFIVLTLAYSRMFPQWSYQLVSQSIVMAVPCVFWIASICVAQTKDNWSLLLGLRMTGMIMEFAMFWAYALSLRYYSTLFKKPPPQTRIAMNLEHSAERQGLFIIVVLGEMVVALIYPNSGTLEYPASLDSRYWKAVLGLLVTLCIQWLYFDGVNRIKTHAMRRHSVSGVLWGTLHFPFSAFLLMAGASMAALVTSKDNGPAVGRRAEEAPTQLAANQIWGFVAPLAASLFTLTCISFTHLYDESRRQRLDVWGKRGISVVCAMAIALVGLGGTLHTLDGLETIAICAAILVFLVIAQMWGRLTKGAHSTDLVETNADGTPCNAASSTKKRIKTFLRNDDVGLNICE